MPEATTLPPRRDISDQYKWNAPSVFASVDAWEATFSATQARVAELPGQFQGKLHASAAGLADLFETLEAVYGDVGKIYVYASMSSATDTNDQTAAALTGRAMSLYSQTAATVAFVEPEILTIGQETVMQWVEDEPRLAVYAHHFADLFRQQAHVRSAEVEELLGMVGDPFSIVSQTARLLANADLKFAPATTAEGEQLSVEQGNVMGHMLSPDRARRRTAHHSYRDGYLALRNTFASNLTAAIKRDWFYARARKHESSLEAALYPYNIPTDVFHNLVHTFRKNLPTWHRYWALRRKALGVDTLHWYDTVAPLAKSQPEVSYQQAVDWICEGMAPLGEHYVATLRRGCLEERWVDVYPNQGKRQGAFSSGWRGTHPFIMMSFQNNLQAMSTLAHELGHSLHSYHTWQHQPEVYSNYSMFVAEVASNFNQALVRAHLLEKYADDPNFQIAMIEEAMSNFRRYFFIMPTLARFELETHERVERGDALTADSMIDLMADLLSEGFGDELALDHDRDGIMWTEFPHLYANFYVFQYATGISAAHALAQGILAGGQAEVDHYLAFLKAGSSLYPLDALKLAGVDMTTPEAVEQTYAVLAGYVDR
ncbi:MAG: oligoendopeptidase F, partial [Anaerolineae bacterium]|nr:oligoendopeptidase F [Anaerolineae bacterium]